MAKSDFSSAEKWLVKKIHRSIGNAPLQLVLGNGGENNGHDGKRTGKVILRDRTALLRMLLDPEVGFGDSYMEGRAEVDGDLVHCLEDVIRAMRAPQAGTWYGKTDFALAGLGAGEYAARVGEEYSYALRSDFGFLQNVAGFADGLYLRVFSDAFDEPGRGAAREDGSRLPQSAASAAAKK